MGRSVTDSGALALGLFLALITLEAPEGRAQEVNELATWVRELRASAPDPSRTATVEDLTLRRDEGELHFARGILQLFTPIDGRTLGAVFVGEGTFRMTAPEAVEQAQIRRLLETDGVDQPFRRAVLLFTDYSDDELAQHVTFGPGPPAPDGRREIEEALKYVSDDKGWFAETLLTPVLNGIGGLFYAHVAWDRGDPIMFEVNPTISEEVALYRKGKGRGDFRETVARFHRQSDYETGSSLPQEGLDLVRVEAYDVEAWIEDNLDFRGHAELRLTPTGSYRWIALSLHSDLEIDTLRWADGSPVAHDRPEESSALWIDLSTAPESGADLVVDYHGDILEQRNGLWVEMRAGRSWIPVYELGRPIPYHLTFHHPEKLRIATVGSLVSEETTDETVTSVWQTPPVRQMTFNVGEFEEHRPPDLTGRTLTVQYDKGAHRQLVGMMPEGVILFEQQDMAGAVSRDLTRAFHFFDEVFGPTPVQDFVASEIPYSHGEAFPGLVLLSWSTFQYTSEKGFDEMFRAHEVAHQWWGIGVRPATYRDQWLAEGFAEFAGLWYAARVNGSIDMYNKRLKETREALVRRRDRAPPISLGTRTATVDEPEDHQLVVYQKGAWVLHMLRTLLTDFDSGSDDLFGRIMKAFYSELYGKAATTAHFQAIVEREVGADMSWFFNQWVHGSSIPKYTFSHRLEDQPDGSVKAFVRIRQERVPADFSMLVPILIDFGDLGTAVVRINVSGPLTEAELPLLPQRPDRLEFNPFEAVLAETDTEGWKGG